MAEHPHPAPAPENCSEAQPLSRRTFIKGALGTAAMAGVSAYFGYRAHTNEIEPVHPIDPQFFGYYALIAHQSLQDAYAITRGRHAGLYYNSYPALGGSIAPNWSFSHAMAASIDTAGTKTSDESHLQRIADTVNGLEYYRYAEGYKAFVGGGRTDTYYDDNAWIGLNLVRAGRLKENEEMIDRAARVFRFIVSGMKNTDRCVPGNAVPWMVKRGKHEPDVNTVSNAPNAQLGLRLHQLTGEDMFIDKAHELYDWAFSHMRDPIDGLYWDHLKPNCSIDRMKWSYNQGTMVGAGLLLYERGAGSGYLIDAEVLAKTSLAYFTGNDMYRLLQQPIEFNVIYFRNLLLLAQKSSDDAFRRFVRSSAEAYAQAVWPKFFTHNKRVGMFDYFPLIEQAAIVQMLAMLDWEPERTDMIV